MGSTTLEIAPGVQLDPEGWAARLGRALQAARQQHAMTLDDVARRSDGRFTKRDLRAFERGERPAGSTLSELLAGLYAIDLAGLAPPRRDLVVDLDAGVVTAGGALRRLSGTADPAADLLQSYLDLVRGTRGAGQSRVSLRADDIAVLSAALDLDEEAVVAALVELMECTKEEARRLLAFLRSGRVAVPLAVVVAVGVGLIATNTFDVPGGSRSAGAPVFVTGSGSAAPTASVVTPVVAAPAGGTTGVGGPSTGLAGSDVGSPGPSGSESGSSPVGSESSTTGGDDDGTGADAPRAPGSDDAEPIRLPGLVVPPGFDNGGSGDPVSPADPPADAGGTDGSPGAGSPQGAGGADAGAPTGQDTGSAAGGSGAAAPDEASTLSDTAPDQVSDAPPGAGGSSAGTTEGSGAAAGSTGVPGTDATSSGSDGGATDPGTDPVDGTAGSSAGGDDTGSSPDAGPSGPGTDSGSGDTSAPGGGSSGGAGSSSDPGDAPAGPSDPGVDSGSGDASDPGAGSGADPGGSSDPGAGPDGGTDGPPADHDNGLHLGNPDAADGTPHTDQGNQNSESPGGGASGGGQQGGQGSGSTGGAGGNGNSPDSGSPSDNHDNGLHLGSPEMADGTPHTDQGNQKSESPGGGKPAKTGKG